MTKKAKIQTTVSLIVVALIIATLAFLYLTPVDKIFIESHCTFRGGVARTTTLPSGKAVSCFIPFADAGQSCTDSSQCSGYCQPTDACLANCTGGELLADYECTNLCTGTCSTIPLNFCAIVTPVVKDGQVKVNYGSACD